jgi:hypothetical protein
MPQAKFKTVINASYEHVLGLLLDKAERPRMYVPVVMHSAVLERGDGYIIREMFQPTPVPLTIKERIYEREVPGGTEFIYEHLNNKDYTGNFHNILKRVPGHADQSEIEYIMDWKPHAGTVDKMSNETAQTMVERGVNFLKTMAENPVAVPPFARAFFDAVDSMKPDAMAPLLAKDCKFRMGNHTEVSGADTIVNMNREVMKMFESVTHYCVDAVAAGNRAYVETYVEYAMPDKKKYLIPFMTMLEQRDGKLTNIKVFGDLSPLKHGW